VSFVDNSGTERILYPTRNTRNGKAILQDNNFQYLFDQDGNILEANESESLKRYSKSNPVGQFNGENAYDVLRENMSGGRYGGQPESMQANGTFFIDQAKGLIHFSSNTVNRVITLQYISDGLAKDEDMVVHKFAEEALYLHIAYSVLLTRNNTPEYVVARFKKERATAKRNAKIRLSNIKIEEIANVIRNKSKQIKH
jgi:hypothetical protein